MASNVQPIAYLVGDTMYDAVLQFTEIARKRFTILKIIDPVSYLDILVLEENARMILTDSRGMQKKAYFFGVPCVTLRPETEWVETVEAGWNIVVGADRERIVNAVSSFQPPDAKPYFFGDVRAGVKILHILSSK